MAYDNTPGAAADAPAAWPAESALARDPAAPTLVMLAHPRCDCTRASLGELAELLARVTVGRGRSSCSSGPAAWPAAGSRPALWRSGGTDSRRHGRARRRRRRGAAVRRPDVGPDAAVRRATARLLYSRRHTGARGKSGDNTGRATFWWLWSTARADRAPRRRSSAAPLFGPVDEPAAATRRGSEHES